MPSIKKGMYTHTPTAYKGNWKSSPKDFSRSNVWDFEFHAYVPCPQELSDKLIAADKRKIAEGNKYKCLWIRDYDNPDLNVGIEEFIVKFEIWPTRSRGEASISAYIMPRWTDNVRPAGFRFWEDDRIRIPGDYDYNAPGWDEDEDSRAYRREYKKWWSAAFENRDLLWNKGMEILMKELTDKYGYTEFRYGDLD